MKKTVSLFLLMTLLLSLTACAGNPVVDDLKTYPGVVKQIVVLEIAFKKTFTEVKTALKDSPESALTLIKTTLIPKSQEMVTTSENGTPKIEALVKVHTVLTDAIKKRHSALIAFEAAVESKEVAAIKSATAKLEETIEGFNEKFIEVSKALEKLNLNQ